MHNCKLETSTLKKGYLVTLEYIKWKLTQLRTRRNCHEKCCSSYLTHTINCSPNSIAKTITLFRSQFCELDILERLRWEYSWVSNEVSVSYQLRLQSSEGLAELDVQDRLLTRLAGDAAVSGELSWLLTRAPQHRL